MKPRIKYGYKLVHKESDDFWSCSVMLSYVRVQYRICQWVSSQKGNGSLAVFDTESNARIFCNEMEYTSRSTCLFRCMYVPTHRKLYYRSKDGIKNRWMFTPDGTKRAAKVMLLEEIPL